MGCGCAIDTGAAALGAFHEWLQPVLPPEIGVSVQADYEVAVLFCSDVSIGAAVESAAEVGFITACNAVKHSIVGFRSAVNHDKLMWDLGLEMFVAGKEPFRGFFIVLMLWKVRVMLFDYADVQ